MGVRCIEIAKSNFEAINNRENTELIELKSTPV